MFWKWKKRWKLCGFDPLSSETYLLEGEYRSEAEVIEAAWEYLHELERNQPTSTSGGQSGSQHHVLILRPDGSYVRFLPSDDKLSQIQRNVDPRSLWGHDFQEYVLSCLKGVPFVSHDEAWQNHLQMGLQVANETYVSSAIRFENLRGDTLSIQCGYALYGGETYRENLPGAMVECYKNTAIVTLHINTFVHFWSLAADLLSHADFLPEIGDISLERKSPHSGPLGFLPIQSLEFDLLAIQIAARGPRCKVRSYFGIVLRDLFIEAVVTHEIGHAILGHLHFNSSAFSMEDYLAESIENLVSKQSKVRALMEVDADDFSAKSLASRISTGVRFGHEREFDLSDDTWILVHLLVRYFVSYTWLICDVLRKNIIIASSAGGWANYPPASFRMFLSAISYKSFLVDQCGFDGARVDRAISALREQIDAIGKRQELPTPLGLGFDPALIGQNLDFLFAYRRELNFEENIEAFRFEPPGLYDQEGRRSSLVQNLNKINVDEVCLRGAVEAVWQMNAEHYDREEARMTAIQAFVLNNYPRNDGGALGMAVNFRLEAMLEIVPALLRADQIVKKARSTDRLIATASSEPLIEDRRGRVCFDSKKFHERYDMSLDI